MQKAISSKGAYYERLSTPLHPDLVRNDLVQLTGEGCRVPGVQIPGAIYYRALAFMLLSRPLSDNPAARQAVIEACNNHPEALWWMQHVRSALQLIQQEAVSLFASSKQKQVSEEEIASSSVSR